MGVAGVYLIQSRLAENEIFTVYYTVLEPLLLIMRLSVGTWTASQLVIDVSSGRLSVSKQSSVILLLVV